MNTLTAKMFAACLAGQLLLSAAADDLSDIPAARAPLRALPAGGAATPRDPLERRHVALDGQGNFRDLGGYETVDGREVAWGQLFRAGELNHLSDADVATLADLGLRTVVDLRSEAEIERRGQDRLPAGPALQHLPIAPDGDLLKRILEAFKSGDFSTIPPDTLARVNEDLLTNASEEYVAIIRLAADPTRRPLVFHCTHGKDRAGMGAALLLAALGVPWETAKQDYLLSNHYRSAENTRELARLREARARASGADPAGLDLTNAEALFYLNASYYDAATRLIEGGYGSPENYIREALGISDAEVASLRRQLLVP